VNSPFSPKHTINIYIYIYIIFVAVKESDSNHKTREEKEAGFTHIGSLLLGAEGGGLRGGK
jgi:hypothetical protein